MAACWLILWSYCTSAQCWSQNSGFQGGRVSQRGFKPSGTAAVRKAPDLLLLLVSCTYSQCLPVLLALCHPEGFRKCFRKGGPQIAATSRGNCGVGKAYSNLMEAVQRRNHRPTSQREGDLPVAPLRIWVDRMASPSCSPGLF